MADTVMSDAGDTYHVPQFAMLDFFFPGFSMIASAVQNNLHIDLNLYIPLLMMFGTATLFWSYSSQYFWEKVETHFMSSVDIRVDDEIYNILMMWVANQRFAKGARRFVANTNINSRSWYLQQWDDDEGQEDINGDSTAQDELLREKQLRYTPSFGSHYFWYRGRLLLFKRNSNKSNTAVSVSEREEISVSCFGRNPWILKELLQEARALHMEQDAQKTLIYRGTSSGSSEPTWQRCMVRSVRPFSTVILNEKTKQDLIEDVTDYLHPATQRWYSNRGIPYRRGYLLHGPPGTGKSSLSLALAGFFKMRVYIVSLSSMSATEENLATLFADLPRRCVVLLEDIDTAGLTHTRENPNTSTDVDDEYWGYPPVAPGNDNRNKNQPVGRLSLSGLLNILDGVASQEGRVLIMTTNHVEKLDKALIRPGRVDMIVEFGLADAEMTASIFRAIFAPLEGDETDEEPRKDETVVEQPDALEVRRRQQQQRQQKDADDRARVEALALEFAAKIPAHEFSPAELQGHLVRYKRDPRAAIDGAEDFVMQTRRDKEEKELEAAEEMRKAEEEAKEGGQKGKNAKNAKNQRRRKPKQQKATQHEKKDSGYGTPTSMEGWDYSAM